MARKSAATRGRAKQLRSGPTSSSLFVGSVAKAFRVLAAFDQGQRSLPLVQIAALSELDLSATQRFVHTLTALGYLRKDERTRHYRLTPRVLHLGTSYLRADELAWLATPYLRAANEKAGETISLLVLDGSDVVHIIRYSAPGSMSMRILIGTRTPAFCEAGGRAILAHMEPDRARDIVAASDLVAYTRFTLSNVEDLLATLPAVREAGYAVVQQEREIDVVTLAAPVFETDGNVVAAVSFAVPLDRWRLAANRKRLAQIALETARAIGTTAPAAGSRRKV